MVGSSGSAGFRVVVALGGQPKNARAALKRGRNQALRLAAAGGGAVCELRARIRKLVEHAREWRPVLRLLVPARRELLRVPPPVDSS